MRSVKINLPVRQAGTRNLAVLFFSLFLTLAVFSQISVANPKPTSDVGLNWLYYKSNNDITAYLGKKSSPQPTVRYQKGNDYLEFSMTGVSSTTSVSLETNVKTPNTPTLFYRNILDGVDANYQITKLPFRVKEEIVLNQNRHRMSVLGQTFIFNAETTAKPVKQDDGSIAFFDGKGDYLFQLDKPFMYDAGGNRSEAVTIEVIPKSEALISNQIPSSNNQTNQNRHPMSVLGQTFDDNNQLFKQFKQFFPVLDLKNWNLFRNSDLEFRNLSNIRQNRHPMSVLGPQQYTLTLKADSAWLSQATYPVIIDPTVTHNADANFTGQFNRIADADTTSSTQLESSYPEATKDTYTVLLLHFNEANGATAGIRDYASTTRVITANGNASTTNYVTQLGMGNSAAFDGTGDYFSIPDSDDWNLGASDFSIETWVNFTSLPTASGQQHFVTQWVEGSGNRSFRLGIVESSGSMLVRFAYSTTGAVQAGTIDSSAQSLSVGKWYHFATIRSGNTLTYYLDGKNIGSGDLTSITVYNASVNLNVGQSETGGFNLNGYLDSLRILKGRALTPEEIKAAASRRPYAVYTSSVLDAAASVSWNTVNWTEGGVNTGNGEQPYNTSSLVAQWDFNDTSGTTLTASSSGSCTTACNGTLTNFAYTASQDQATTTTGWTANNKKWGAGALMMESAAAADYVSITDPASNVLDPNSADLTVETWIKTSDTSAEIFSNNNGNGTACTNNGYYLGIDASGYPAFYLDTNGATAGCDASTTSQFKINDGNWHKVAVSVTRGTSAVIYVDGKSAGSDTSVTSYSAITVTGNGFFGGSAGGLDAVLDSSRFYSRALSAAEILSNYNAGNIEIQTRTGATSDPNDGSWEAWKPTTGETQLLSMDSDKANWNAPEQIDGYTKLLLHMDGTDAATTFPNSATTTHTITAVNQAQVDTAQSKFSGGSGLFDGTGDGVRIDGNADFVFAADFTIDTWIRTTSTANMHFYGTTNESAWTTDAWHMGYFNGNLVFGVFTNANTQTFASGSLHDGNWHHIAITRSGTTIRMFADGVEKGSFTDSRTLGNATFRIAVGAQDPTMSSEAWNGWLDEFRISKGIARWTSNFTPPPRPYGSNVKSDNETTIKQEGTGSTKLTLGAPQVDGNTVALWHFEETGTTTGTYLYDETANNNDATTTGTTVVDGIFGKGRKFGTNGDYLSVADSANWDLGSSFSIDFWINRYNLTDIHWLGHYGDGAGGDEGWYIAQTGTNIDFRTNNNALILGTAHGMSVNTWNHIAYTGDGSNLRLYINGILKGSAALSSVQVSARPLIIGSYAHSPGGAIAMNGTLDELRILKGRALSADEIAETYRMGANHHLTRQVSATDLSSANKLAFNVASDRPGTYLETMLGESDYANYELASSTLALSTTTVLYIKGDEIASSTAIKDSSFSGKAITANGNARTAGGGKIGNAVAFDGAGDYLSVPASSDWGFGSGDFAIDMWVYPTSNPNAYTGVMGLGASGSDSMIYTKHSASSGNMQASMRDTGGVTYIYTTTPISLNVWQHIALVRNGNNLNFYLNSNLIGSADVTGKTMAANSSALAIGIDEVVGAWLFFGYMDEIRVIKGSTLTPDQIRQAYEYGLRSHTITIDFGATLQTSDLISNSTDYNFNITATTSGLSATTSGLYLGDKIIIKENLGGTEYTAQGTVNAINTATGAITVPSWDTGSTFPASNGYSPNATVFKWQREYFDITGAATTTRNAITNLTLRPTNGAEGRTIYLDDFKYNTNYLTASSSSAITSSNNRYLQYRAIFSSWDSFVSPYLSAINTLYTSTANMFGPIIGISGGGFLSF